MVSIKGIKYNFIRTLGEGAQGEVKLVEDENTKQKYALKIYNDTVPEKSIEREIEILTNKHHPNILKVIDYGAIENNFYTISNYISGGSLDMYIDKGTLTLDERLRILRDVLLGLEFLHNDNIIHRDIKPGNIFVNTDNQFKGLLGDFGLAKSREDSLMEYSLAGGMMGTIAFLPPEYLRNHTRVLDAKTDLYAVGVSLYKCITGNYPYGQNEQELLSNLKNLDYRPPVVRKYVARTPKTLQELCERALSVEKEERFVTARQFIMNIETILDEEDLLYNCPKPGDIELKLESKKKIPKKKKRNQSLEAKEKVTKKTNKYDPKMKALIGFVGTCLLLSGYGMYTALNRVNEVHDRKIDKVKLNTPEKQETQKIVEHTKKEEKEDFVKHKKSWNPLPEFYSKDINQLDPILKNLLYHANFYPKKDYVDALYHHVFLLYKKGYKTNKTQYDSFFTKAILLKSLYSSFSFDDLDTYEYIPSTRGTMPVARGNRTMYLVIPQYLFLANLKNRNKTTLQLRNVGKEFEMYFKAKNAYYFISNCISKINDIKDPNLKNIAKELEADALAIAANTYSNVGFPIDQEILKQTYEKVDIKGKKYMKISNDNNETTYTLTQQVLYIDSFINVISQELQSDNQYIKLVDKLSQQSDTSINTFMNNYDFSHIEIHENKYIDLLKESKNFTEKEKLYIYFHHKKFNLKVFNTLITKATNIYLTIKDKKGERINDKIFRDLGSIINSSDETQTPYALNKLSTFYKDLNKESHPYTPCYDIKLIDIYSKLTAEQVINDDLFQLVDKNMKNGIKNKQYINLQSITYPFSYAPTSWLELNYRMKNYKYIISFTNELETYLLPSINDTNANKLDNLSILLKYYNSLNESKNGIDFINEKKALQICDQFITNNAGMYNDYKSTYNTLTQMMLLYQKEPTKYQNEIKHTFKLAQQALKHMKK